MVGQISNFLIIVSINGGVSGHSISMGNSMPIAFVYIQKFFYFGQRDEIPEDQLLMFPALHRLRAFRVALYFRI